MQLCGSFEHSLALPFFGTGMKTDLYSTITEYTLFLPILEGLKNFFLIGEELLYNVVLVSTIQQHE